MDADGPRLETTQLVGCNPLDVCEASWVDVRAILGMKSKGGKVRNEIGSLLVYTCPRWYFFFF